MHLREATRCTRFPLPSRKEPDTSQDDSEQRWIELPHGPACLSINYRRHPGRPDSYLENLSLPKFGCMNPPLRVAADKHSNGLQHTTAFHSSFCSSLCLPLIMAQLWFPHIEFFKGKTRHTNMYSSWLWKQLWILTLRPIFCHSIASHLWGATLVCFGFNRSCQTLAAISAVLLGHAGRCGVCYQPLLGLIQSSLKTAGVFPLA